MKTSLRNLTLFGGLLLATSAMAAPMGVVELGEAAVRNREAILSGEAVLFQSEEAVTAERSRFLPRIDAAYKANRLDEKNVMEAEENASWQIVASQNLFSGFQDKNLLAAARLRNRAGHVALDSLRQDLRFDAALGLLAVYQARAEREVAERAYTLYVEKYENAKLQHAVGVIRKADLLKFKVVLDDAIQDRIRAHSEVEKALNGLSRITGLSLVENGLDFSAFDVLSETEAPGTLEARMLEKKSELTLLKLERAIAGTQISVARAGYLPKVDLSFSYKESGDDYGVSDNSDDETRVHLAVSLNLFDGMAKYAKIRTARLEEKRIGHDVTETEKTLKLQLKNLLLDAKVARENLMVALSSVEEAEEHLRVTEFSYKEGVSTATDLLDAIFYLSRAEGNEIQARTAYQQTVLSVKRLVAGFDGAEI